MDALRQLQPHGRPGVFQPPHGINPRSRRIDDQPTEYPSAGFISSQPVIHHHPAGPATFCDDGHHWRIAQHARAMGHGAAHIGQGQPRIVGQIFGIDHGTRQVIGRKAGFPQHQVSPRPNLMSPILGHATKLFKSPHAGPQLGGYGGVLRRDHEGCQSGQMGRHPFYRLTF